MQKPIPKNGVFLFTQFFKKMKKSIFIISVTLAASISIISYYFQNATNSYANSGQLDPISFASILEGNNQNYFFIPSISEFLKKIQSNAKIAKIVQSEVSKEIFQHPPFAGFGPISYVLDQLPGGIANGLIQLFFSGSFYYSYSPQGFLGAFDLTKAGELAISKFSASQNKLPFVYTVINGRLFFSNQEKFIAQLKSILPNIKLLTNTTLFKSDKAYLHFSHTKYGQNGKDILQSFFKTFFPPRVFQDHQLVFDVNEKGLALSLNSNFITASQEPPLEPAREYRVMASSLFSAKDVQLHSQFKPQDSLFLQMHLDSQFLAYLAHPSREYTYKNNQSTSFMLNSLQEDYGILLTELSIHFSKQLPEAENFFKGSFDKIGAKKTKNKTEETIRFPRYSYYDDNNNSYKFTPTLLELGNQSLVWSSTQNVHEQMVKFLDRKNLIKPDNDAVQTEKRFLSFLNRHNELKITSSDIPLFTLKVSLEHLLSKTADQIKPMTGNYYITAFDDFKSTLKPLSASLKGSMLWGRSLIKNSMVTSIFELEL